jgi:hypothetical protein
VVTPFDQVSEFDCNATIGLLGIFNVLPVGLRAISIHAHIRHLSSKDVDPQCIEHIYYYIAKSIDAR